MDDAGGTGVGGEGEGEGRGVERVRVPVHMRGAWRSHCAGRYYIVLLSQELSFADVRRNDSLVWPLTERLTYNNNNNNNMWIYKAHNASNEAESEAP